MKRFSATKICESLKKEFCRRMHEAFSDSADRFDVCDGQTDGQTRTLALHMTHSSDMFTA